MTQIMKTKSTPSKFSLAITLALALFATHALAAKPPKGGGGGSEPATSTTIYYYHFDSLPTYRMKADGRGKTALGMTGPGWPSGLLHGGKRWFLQENQAVEGEAGGHVFAVNEDGAGRVRLTDDPSLEILYLDWTPAENADQAVVSGVAQRRGPDGLVDPASIGVYSAILRFDSEGNVIGLDAPPEFVVSLGVVAFEGGEIVPDIWNEFSWSPDMTRIVVDRNDGSALRVIEIATGEETVIATGYIHYPQWSPDGSKIAFVSSTSSGHALDLIAPDGSGRTTLVTSRWDALLRSRWSPDSAHLAYQLMGWNSPHEEDIWRISVSGGSKANLTKDVSLSTYILGWR